MLHYFWSCSVIMSFFCRLIFLSYWGITTFHSLSVSSIAISRYPNIVLMISAHTFFFNKKMACNTSVSAFMANVLNSIIKSVICFFPFLKVLIFYSASAALLLLLNVFLISHMNLFQSWVSISLSSLSSFFWT